MRIYLVAPAGHYTGGPTAIFQLSYYLKKYFDIPVSVAFINVRDGESPVHPNYKKYEVPWTLFSRIRDEEENLVIVPETLTWLLNRFKKVRKAIYWLAVDNFFLSRYFNRRMKTLYFYKDVLAYWLRYRHLSRHIGNDVRHYISCAEAYNALKDPGLRDFLSNIDLHIAQSIYAKNFLLKLGLTEKRVFLLREPLEEEFIYTDVNIRNKRDVVAFNARKAFSITYEAVSIIKKIVRNVKIIPLLNVGKDGMLRLLSLSKVFIDIGLHPGRDRPPREAGALSNVVIVNKSGGCYHFEDCPIPRRWIIPCQKIACRDANPHIIAELTANAIENYQQIIEEFRDFRNHVKLEPESFIKDIEYLLNHCELFN